MTDLRERLGKLRADAEDEGRRFKNVLLSADKVLALLDVAEAAERLMRAPAIRTSDPGFLAAWDLTEEAVSRLSTAIGGQHE